MRMSSTLITHEFKSIEHDIDEMRRETPKSRLTLADRISPEQRAKLNAMLGSKA